MYPHRNVKKRIVTQAEHLEVLQMRLKYICNNGDKVGEKERDELDCQNAWMG